MTRTNVGLVKRMSLGAGAIASIATLALGLQAAPVASASTTATSATVVKRVSRSPIGSMLATTKGASLYIHPGGPCNASCRAIWPPLLMPAGTTVPLGAKCLSTVAFGTNRLQVRYHAQKLYTFTGDSGTSVNGNKVAGFVAAKVTTACP